MRTESEYQQLFLENCLPENADVAGISRHYWIDMTAHLNTYFSHENRSYITIHAAELLKAKVTGGTSPNEAWKEVIRDFLTNNYWDCIVQAEKPPVKKTEEQKNFRTLVKYGLVLFLSSILLKIAVTFFGVQGSYRPDLISPAWVWITFGVLLVCMFVFAFRAGNDED